MSEQLTEELPGWQLPGWRAYDAIDALNACAALTGVPFVKLTNTIYREFSIYINSKGDRIVPSTEEIYKAFGYEHDGSKKLFKLAVQDAAKIKVKRMMVREV